MGWHVAERAGIYLVTHLDIASSDEISFKEKGKRNAMIVVADGDIIRNQIQSSTGKVYPLGFDRYTQQQFGNKTFLLNCMNYLLDDSGLIAVRTRDIQIRLLDKTILQSQKLNWQLICIAGPILSIVLFGLLSLWKRKKKYATAS